MQENNYFKLVVMIERLHRLFLEVLDVEIKRMKIMDINSVQALMLYNIGHELVMVGDLTVRGYYLGSNVSYNLVKMVQNNYIIYENNPQDRRSHYVKLSAKGLNLFDKLDKILELQSESLAKRNLNKDSLLQANGILDVFEEFWTGQKS